MANLVTIGMQWGDEGKGKIVDLLCPAFDAVARFQGGHNAGHTVKFGDRHFALHLIPSGILHPGMLCVLGNGMVIDPEAFFSELESLRALGVELRDNLFVSNRAHLLLPPHPDLDRAREESLGKDQIGTTARGIGPAYEIKASRHGLRICDLYGGNLEERLRAQLWRIETELSRLSDRGLGHPGKIADLCRSWRERFQPYLADTGQLLNRWIGEGKAILFEGAQGTLLDVDHGTYPFVTSSNACAGAASTGTGVPPTRIDGTLGVLKAYTTRVGGGPFPTELEEETGEFLRRRGNEFGTTTGRPRRCGWLDLVAARYASVVNGVGGIALTKLDVLDELEEIPVCVGYRLRGSVQRDFPAEIEALEAAEPVYRTLEGWRQETVGVLEFADLPQAARDYIAFIEEQVEAPVVLVSTGPRREETMVRDSPVLGHWAGSRLEAVLQGRGPA